MTASVFTLSIETTIYPAFQAPYHVGTDERIARLCAEETFTNRKWFAHCGRVTIRTVALMRDGHMVDVFDGDWASDLWDRDMAEMEEADMDARDKHEAAAHALPEMPAWDAAEPGDAYDYENRHGYEADARADAEAEAYAMEDDFYGMHAERARHP